MVTENFWYMRNLKMCFLWSLFDPKFLLIIERIQSQIKKVVFLLILLLIYFTQCSLLKSTFSITFKQFLLLSSVKIIQISEKCRCHLVLTKFICKFQQRFQKVLQKSRNFLANHLFYEKYFVVKGSCQLQVFIHLSYLL